MDMSKGEEFEASGDQDLPVYIDGECHKKHPEFSKLLQSLRDDKCIADNGVTSSLWDKLEKAKERFEESRRFYLEHKIVYDVVQDLVLFNANRKPSGMQVTRSHPREPSPDEAWCKIAEKLRRSELCTSIFDQDDKESSTHLLNLTSDYIRNGSPCLEESIVQEHLIPVIEAKLTENFLQVSSMLLHEQDTKSSIKDSVSRFQASLSEKTKLLDEEKQKLSDMKTRKDQLYQKYYMQLETMTEMLMTHLTGEQLEAMTHQKKLAHHINAKCATLASKAEAFHLQLLSETYTKETVAALKVIRDKLNHECEHLEHEIAKMTELLEVYKSAGSTFQQLVEDYAALEKEIECKTWASKALCLG